MTYLDEIIEHKRQHKQVPAADLERRASEAPAPRSLLQTTGSYRSILIAECKRASPSKGLLAPNYDPVALARVYSDNGASAISVLTDEKFFQGSLDDLIRVRSAVDLPLLRKDFTLDESDVLEARAAGADLILLIVRVLPPPELENLIRLSSELGMESIVEVHDEDEVQVALGAAAPIVGINNRDLRTFQTDIAVTERLLKVIPDDVVVISESGIRSGDQVHRLQQAGVNGVLAGECLITASDTAALVAELVDAGCPDCWKERTSLDMKVEATRP